MLRSGVRRLDGYRGPAENLTSDCYYCTRFSALDPVAVVGVVVIVVEESRSPDVLPHPHLFPASLRGGHVSLSVVVLVLLLLGW